MTQRVQGNVLRASIFVVWEHTAGTWYLHDLRYPTQNLQLHEQESYLEMAIQTSEPFLPHPFTLTEPKPQLITQGAEALIYKTHFLDESTPAALKVRPAKPYRHPTLDARLTKQRVLAEARVLVKLSGIEEVKVPGVLSLEWDLGRRVKGLDAEKRGDKGGGAWLLMEWVEGKSLKEVLREWDVWHRKETGTEEEKEQGEQDVKMLLRRIGKAVGAMHSKGGVVHGDLTSSNIMIRPKQEEQANGVQQSEERKMPTVDGEIVLIDFGLATQAIQDEDRAVDLYVLERAFGSTHPRQEAWFGAEVLQGQDGYRGSFKGANVVLKRLDEVRLRGRKRSMVG